MSEQQLDLAGTYRVLRDHWITCLVFVLLGLAVGVGYVIERPPLYSATSLVLFPGQAANTSNTNSSANDMTTASQVATSAGVLVPAGRHADAALSPSVLKERVKASGVATNVLQITAAGTTAAQATALANAVASQLVAFETTVGSATEGTVLGGLQSEVGQLTTQIEDLNHQITSLTAAVNVAGASSSVGMQDTALIASLSTQQSQATLQLNSVNAQIAQVKAGAVASGQGTQVIQHATVANPPSIVHKVFVGGLGALGGLIVATLLLLVRYRRDPRLHRRDQIAQTVGVPVLMSSSASGRHRTSSDWLKVLKDFSPSDASRWNVQQMLRSLELENRPNHLVVLSISGDHASLAAAIQIAITSSGFGLSTSFEIKAQNETAKPLRAVCNRLSAETDDLRPNLRVSNGRAKNGAVPALTLTCIVVDGTRPNLPLVDSPEATLLVVSSGFATANQLASVAIAADDVGLPLKGVIVTNPDSDDRTTGRFPQTTPRHARSPQAPKLASRGSL